MKNLMLLLFVLTVLASCNQQEPKLVQPSGINNEDEKILRNLKEVQWPKAYREQDTVLLDRILGNDFQMIDAGGTWSNKVKELEWIKENAMENDSFFYEIKRLDILPNGTALICGTGHIFNDSTETIYQSSNILIKRKDAWKAVASHVSGIKTLD
nr:nuclear transport factor 2 family protein [uncultured Allomuricauda sp.]